MKYKIYNQDVIEWAKEYQKAKFHALISDAPYHLTSIVKRYSKVDTNKSTSTNDITLGRKNQYGRLTKGFMNQEWDGGDIAFRPETWEALGEHLYPGAFGMCFSASRNWHRLAVAIEDAGMIIHPTIFGWLQGQGFPKATNISKRLKKQGNEDGMWEGHRYGLQALKPSVEPIIVFQKPYEGKPLQNIVDTGAGALNIDGGRIAVDVPVTINRFTNGAKPWGDAKGEEFDTVLSSQGRWPSNFILDKSSAELLDSQTGILISGKPSGKKKANNNIYGKYNNEDIDVKGIGDSGGASRFFYNVQERIDEADPIYYCSKVSPKERNAGLNERCIHPTMKPIALAKYLATLLLPPKEYAPRRILVPFSGVGSEMIGCALAGWEHIVGIEFMEEYVGLAYKRMEYWSTK